MMKKLHLKKLLLMAIMLVGAGSAWAGDVIFDFQQSTENYDWNGTPADKTDLAVNDCFTNGTVTFTYTAKGSGSTDLRWWNTDDGLRSYKGNKFKIATTAGTITKITIQGTCVLQETTETNGTISNNRNWTQPEAGGITEVEFECNQSTGNKTIKKVTVTIASSLPSSDASFANETPSMDLKDATSFTQTATTASGYTGTVTYSMDANTAGATIDASTGEVTPTKAGSVTVRAIAAEVEGSWDSSTATYTLTVTDGRESAGLAWSPTSVEIEKGATDYTLPTLTNPHSVEVTYTASGTEGLASVSNNIISINTNILGTATIKATYAGGTYKPATVSCTIQVYDPDVKGSKQNPYTVADIIEKAPTSTTVIEEDVYVKGYIIGTVATQNNNNTGVVIGDLITDVTSDTNIAIADDPTDTENYCSVQLPSGAIRTALNAKPANHPYYIGVTQVLVKGDVAKYCGIAGIKNTSEGEVVGQKIQVTSAGLATYCTDVNLKFDGDVEAYIAKEENGAIKLQKVENVPANTGVLLRAKNISADTYFDVNTTTDTDAVTGNIFQKGTDAAVASEASGKYNYILNKVNGEVGFYRAAGQKVAKNRAYLQTTISATANGRLAISFNDETTDISNINVNDNFNANVYDLQGRRVTQPTKGLYIVNGKKVIFK